MKKFFCFFILTLSLALYACNNNEVKFEIISTFAEVSPNESTNRVYTIFVPDFSDDIILWEKMEEFAIEQEYSDNAMTIVYFFSDKMNTPDVTYIGNDFDPKYEQYCVAGFWRYATGETKFNQYPFK